jgi:hypothetical protein
LPNETFRFRELEILRDTGNNQGTVIGQNSIAVGVKMEPGDSFDITRPISTVGRVDENGDPDNFTIQRFVAGPDTGEIFSISAVNDSSPGALYANTGVITDVQVEELENTSSVSLITDLISNFLAVPIDSSNYNTVPPALIPMSGTANPVTRFTPIDEAFDLEPFTIGTIKSFKNINPGADYVNDTFSIAIDEVMTAFDRYDQIIVVSNFSASFSVGDLVQQPANNVTGIINAIDNTNGVLYVTPYDYYGFRGGTGAEFTHKGHTYSINAVNKDYNSEKFGLNADIQNETLFSQGRISAAEIRNSGFGYNDGEIVTLVDDEGTHHARAVLSAKSQGITAGFWGSESSQINGYYTDPIDKQFKYYDSEMKIQDSDLYQEYSYVIKSVVDQNKYRDVVKDTVHLAGSKLFGQFAYEQTTGPGMSAKLQVIRKDDYVVGGDPIVGPNQDFGDQVVRADNFVYTVDDTVTFTVDNDN